MIKQLYLLVTEPFRIETDPCKPIVWRLGMRWSHLPNWLRKMPCSVFGHKYNRWQQTKYTNDGEERCCVRCDNYEVRLYSDMGSGNE